MIYPNTLTIYRDNYATYAEYLDVYRDCLAHYDYKSRVYGGWRFFAYQTDYQIWRDQK